MAREEIISSAVSFLRDPNVSVAPLEKKVAFLQSKNLTQEEIETSLSRVGEDPSSVAAAAAAGQSAGSSQPQQSSYRPAGPAAGQAYAYGPPQQWQHAPPPPELPKRDWRDWFIMATMMGGVGYGLYFVAKRYITPLIAPPTPPQLQQDKEAIDEQFSRAFALLDQLASDTASLKAAEDARTERLDSALREVEDVVADMKSSSRRRDDETRRISDEVKSLKDGIPKAIEGAREGNEKRLKELGSELKSLKVLLGNRLGSSTASGTPAVPSPTAPRPATVENAPSQSNVNGTSSAAQQPSSNSTPASPPTQAATTTNTAPPAREQAGSPFSQLGKPASIPAWQMAATSKPKPAAESSTNDSTQGNANSAGEQSSAAPPS